MITCFSLGYFAAAVEVRHQAKLAETPLVIGGQAWEPQPVYGFSQAVARTGVRPGTTLRLAHILSPQAHFMPATPTSYLEASGEVIDILTDFSDVLEPEELWLPSADPLAQAAAGGQSLPARYYLDLDGSPAEMIPFVQKIGRVVRRHTHLAPAIGLSRHKLAAQIAAALAHPNHIWPVPIGQEAEFLARRSLSFLPLAEKTRLRLYWLGVRTLGQLTALPLLSLQTQFGADIKPWYALAQGEPKRVDYASLLSVQAVPTRQREQANYQFESPVTNRLTLTATLTHLAQTLAGRLQAADLEGRRLCLAWETGSGERVRRQLTLRQPSCRANQLAAACEQLLAELSDSSGIAALSITMIDLTPALPRQLGLFDQPLLADQAHQTLHNVIAKYGGDSFYQPVLIDDRHPLPERRIRLNPVVYDPAVA